MTSSSSWSSERVRLSPCQAIPWGNGQSISFPPSEAFHLCNRPRSLTDYVFFEQSRKYVKPPRATKPKQRFVGRSKARHRTSKLPSRITLRNHERQGSSSS